MSGKVVRARRRCYPPISTAEAVIRRSPVDMPLIPPSIPSQSAAGVEHDVCLSSLSLSRRRRAVVAVQDPDPMCASLCRRPGNAAVQCIPVSIATSDLGLSSRVFIPSPSSRDLHGERSLIPHPSPVVVGSLPILPILLPPPALVSDPLFLDLAGKGDLQKTREERYTNGGRFGLGKVQARLLGGPIRGKTSIITRFMYDKFDTTYQTHLTLRCASNVMLDEGMTNKIRGATQFGKAFRPTVQP
ncbi:Ras-related protein RABH1d [Platanthera guangdongensis]|uniref:Ras-related protein RABH1d n=1 Tax=Platanthera guangdongensis TaxID=2320717 RepID=A0ABR2N5I2_9ASPA